MVPSDSSHVTALLAGWREGDEEAGRELVEVVYRELRRVASAHLRRESNAMTLQPTALVNELCVKLLSNPR